MVYPANGRFPHDTRFAITVSNSSSRALKSVVTITLTGDVELAADVHYKSCRTTGTTVVCKHRAPRLWPIVPAHGSFTYRIYLDHRNSRGQVVSMPLPSVNVDPNQ